MREATKAGGDVADQHEGSRPLIMRLPARMKNGKASIGKDCVC